MFNPAVKRRLTVAAALVVLLLVQALPALAGTTGTYDEALALAAREGKPVVLDFFTDW